MKKIIPFGACILAFLVFSPMAFAQASGSYNPDTYEIEITYHPGWNIVPYVVGTSEFIVNECDFYASYYWSPTERQYFGGLYGSGSSEFSQKVAEDAALNYYTATTYMGAGWVYSKNYCVTKTQLGSPGAQTWNEQYKDQVFSGLVLKKGWNFVTVNPFMVGLKWEEILSECNLEAVNMWDAREQKWGFESSSEAVQYLIAPNVFALNEMQVGNTYVMKFEDDCYFSQGTSGGPPQLPGV